MNKLSKTLALIGFITTSFLSYANLQQNSIPSDTRWNILSASRISPDGNWALVYNKNTFDQTLNSTDYVNTQSGQKVDITKLNGANNHMLYNDILVGKKQNKIEIVHLHDEQNSFSLEKIKRFETRAKLDHNLLLTLSDEFVLEIRNLNNKNEVVFLDTFVDEFALNPNKNILLYRKSNIKNTLFTVDLNTTKKQSINLTTESLKSLYWNTDQDIFAFLTNDNNLKIVNIKLQSVKELALDKEKLERFELKFYSNNDVFIKYNIKTDQTIEGSDFLDIWNGNSKFLSPSLFNLKYELKYKALVYKYKEEVIHKIDRSRENDCEFVNIPNHILTYNPFLLIDYQDTAKRATYTLVELSTNKQVLSTTVARGKWDFIPSKDSKHLLYVMDEKLARWGVYTIQTQKKVELYAHNDLSFKPTWSLDSKNIYYTNKNEIWDLNLTKNQHQKLSDFKLKSLIHTTNDVRFENYDNTFINTAKPAIFVSTSIKGTAIYSLQKNRLELLKKANNTSLTKTSQIHNLISQDAKTIVYTEENLLTPPTVKLLKNKKESTIVSPNLSQELYNWNKCETIDFKDKYDVPLKAMLYYPKDYDPTKKYPMIVYIYDRIHTSRSFSDRSFKSPDPLNGVGFNHAKLNEDGYFICYIDTYVSNEGPGLSAVECVTKGVEAVTASQPSIDKTKLGLIGHSFGGYKTSFIATHSNLFSAIVSGAGAHDFIGGFTYRFSNYRYSPDWFMAETAQYDMKQSYAENPQKYIDNSPILHAQNVNTPLLIWTGLLDENVYWENTRKMYIALLRYKKPTIALFYNDMDHGGGFDAPKQTIDLVHRVNDWFDYFLKDKHDKKWIKEGIKNPYSWNQLDDF
ncbi:alpha/beta hydrolase family protein [Myroides odoratimimus]|uniref:alpha/beta hydrolase family protein n=1 Tax=Myroides odoratimimus TaxID=76832 RepID=UPI0029C0E993|nr:prolyl oligopeptidase family serine peptidase [Myroides odoratimimus]MDX4973938.1 prolyl oligopeptidase family serine peptidase [Myroides odoratimimus]